MLNQHEKKLLKALVVEGVRSRPKSATAERLSSAYSVGRYSKSSGKYAYSAQDVATAKAILERHGIPLAEAPLVDRSRNEVAKQFVDEKSGADSVFATPIAFKVLDTNVLINDDAQYPSGLFHCQADCQDIKSVSATHLVLVENLESFKKLSEFVIDLPGALFIWRGGPFSKLSFPNTEKYVVELSRRTGIPVTYFGDFDLKGLMIGLEMHAHSLLLPDTSEIEAQQVVGNSKLFDTQFSEYRAKKAKLDSNSSLKPYFDALLTQKVGYTQERMSAFSICHRVVLVSR